MAPFLDPGSIIVENSQQHGYELLYKTLRDHKDALHQPSWKFHLNYQTDWIIQDQIANTTYGAMIQMNKVNFEMEITEP